MHKYAELAHSHEKGRQLTSLWGKVDVRIANHGHNQCDNVLDSRESSVLKQLIFPVINAVLSLW